MIITINDREIRIDKPVTILEAAKANGIHIPHLCHHPVLEQWGGCRMCLVEVEKMPRLQTACTLYVTEGMKIRTESEAISNARRAVLEFLLINHPLECPICDKGGECKLQDYTMKYGPTAGRFKEAKLKHPEHIEDSLIVRNIERCIKCTRCVRMCDGVQGASAIAMSSRGNHTLMEPFSGGVYECEYCGNCLTVCPVGAIMSRLHRYKYRPWQLTGEVKTVCSYCGVGCTMLVQVRDNSIMRTVPKIGLGVNKGLLCNRGRFGYEYVESPDRLSVPLIKKNGALEPASWREALDTVASRLREIKNSSGGNAIAGISGSRCTNEENYVFQKLLRGLGSNNIDSIARMGTAGALRVIEGFLGAGSTANQMSDIASSDTVFAVGGDPTQVNPVLGLQVRAAYRKGAKVIAVGYSPGLKRYKTLNLLPAPYAEDGLLAGIVGLLLGEKSFSRPDIENKIKSIKLPAIDEVEGSTALKREDIEAAVSFLSGSSSAAIVIGRNAMQRASSLLMLSAIADLIKAKVYIMSERPNEMGLIDMGCTPDALPGGIRVESAEQRKKLAGLWGFEPPADEGYTLMEMMARASSGDIKAMYVMGENPAFNLPDSGFVREAIGKLQFLVVQDIFMTETAKMADVVLPALGWAEKDGTYTNLERRIQRLRKAVTRENCKEDWRVVVEVGERLGIRTPYGSSNEILSEIRKASPLHSAVTDKDIDKGAAIYPYAGPYGGVHIGPVKIEEIELSAGKSNGKLVLALEKPLFHSGTLSRKSPALNSIYPEAIARINPETASSLGLKDGDNIRVSSTKGGQSLKVKTDESVQASTVLLTNNFEDKGAYGLAGFGIEPVTEAPVMERTELSIEKAT